MARNPRYGPHNYERILGQRNYNFAATVSDFVAESKERLTLVTQYSLQDVFNEASLSDDKGGKMRVDTGFLRASGKISLTGMPTGPGRGERTEPNSYPFDDNIAVLSLAGFRLGMSVFMGWTANYAKYREAYDGFLFSAVQNWQGIVSKRCREIANRRTAR